MRPEDLGDEKDDDAFEQSHAVHVGGVAERQNETGDVGGIPSPPRRA